MGAAGEIDAAAVRERRAARRDRRARGAARTLDHRGRPWKADAPHRGRVERACAHGRDVGRVVRAHEIGVGGGLRHAQQIRDRRGHAFAQGRVLAHREPMPCGQRQHEVVGAEDQDFGLPAALSAPAARKGVDDSSSSSDAPTSTRSRAQKSAMAAAKAGSPTACSECVATGSSPRASLCKPCAPPSKRGCRARCRIRSPGSSRPRSAGRARTRACPSSAPTACPRRRCRAPRTAAGRRASRPPAARCPAIAAPMRVEERARQVGRRLMRAVRVLVAAEEERPVRGRDVGAALALERDAGLGEPPPLLLHLLALVVRERRQEVGEVAVARIVPVELHALAREHAERLADGHLVVGREQHVQRREVAVVHQAPARARAARGARPPDRREQRAGPAPA